MRSYRFDALIITALSDELQAVLAAGEGGKDAWTSTQDSDGFPYHHRELPREDGSTLRIAAASFDEMGETQTAGRAGALIKELEPACLAMCGICAGKKDDVTLGDVIVADRVYSYDDGKLLAHKDEEGRRVEELRRDLTTYNLQATWKSAAKSFASERGDWIARLVGERPPTIEAQERWLLRTLDEYEQKKVTQSPHEHPERNKRCPAFVKVWSRLRERELLVADKGRLALTEEGRAEALELLMGYPQELPPDRDFKIHVGPIATGKTVRKDPELFKQLEQFGRRTLGAEMEAAAIGAVAEQLGRQAIIVKAVSDYGDHDKDDAFRKFAARASDEVLDNAYREALEHAGPFRGDDLLSRIQQVADLRAQATGKLTKIDRIRAQAPFGAYLRVTTAERTGLQSEHLVAAIEQVTGAALDTFLAEVDRRDRQLGAGFPTLVYGGDPPLPDVAAKAAKRNVLLQSFTEYQGLIDFGSYLQRQTQRLEADPVYPPGLYIEQRGTDGDEDTDDVLGRLSDLLASPHGRFVLVLGDFGTGKTFLLHELARRMARDRKPRDPVPVLIELRALEKAAQLDTLISQHLSLAGMERIDLPAFRYMLAQGRIVLLFDGFDELALRVTYDRAVAEHFATLIQAAQGEAKVVITSRTQHFFSDKQVMLELARHASNVKGYRLLKLRPFEKAQILRFLEKRLGSTEEAERRFKLLDEVQDLLGLSENPRMLGFIAGTPEEDLRAAKARNQKLTSAGLYELLLGRWLGYELKRAHPKGALPGLDLPQRWKAVTELALRLWQRPERAIDVRELPADLLASVKALAPHDVDPEVVRHQIGSGTLLVREEEKFSFIHQSVMEWLVAKAAAQVLEQDGRPDTLAARAVSPLMADFVWGLAGRERAEQWAQDVLAEGRAGTVAHQNALLMLKRLGVEARVPLQLAGQDLRGQDFSGQDLRHADLTGALLTGASFLGTDLRGARLVRAQLQRADLSNARLDRANLEDANLLAARLLGASARGARFARSRLREAKLIRAELDRGALAGCDVFGAVLPEGGKPQPMVSAATWCYAVAFSPDRRLLATGHDGSIWL